MNKSEGSDYSKIYWRKAKRWSYFFQFIPFVRAVILNGSAAQGRAKRSSDIDILIIAKDKRIFTVRFFVNVLAILPGQKRSSDETKPHAGKFCFNYFLAESCLKIPGGRGREIDQYCAENYSSSILLAGDRKLFERFVNENKSLFSLTQNSPPKADPPLAEKLISQNYDSGPKTFMSLLGSSGELILNGRLGDWLEARLKRYQIRRIERDPRTEMYPDLIAYNDRELRFHPPKQN